MLWRPLHFKTSLLLDPSIFYAKVLITSVCAYFFIFKAFRNYWAEVPSLKCQSILEVNNYDSDLTTCWNTGDEAITKLFLSEQSNYKTISEWPKQIQNYFWVTKVITKLFLIDQSNYQTISEWPKQLQNYFWVTNLQHQAFQQMISIIAAIKIILNINFISRKKLYQYKLCSMAMRIIPTTVHYCYQLRWKWCRSSQRQWKLS